MSVIKRIDLKEDECAFYGKKHVIELKTSPGGEELFFDGRKVSSGKFSGEFRSILNIEDNRKQESYEVTVKEESQVHLGVDASLVDTPASIARRHTRPVRPSILPDLQMTRSLKAAVIPDGKIVYNEGLLISSS